MKKEKRLFHRKKPTDSDDQYILHLIKLYLKFGKEPIPRSEMYPDEYSSNDGKIFAENLRDFLGKNLYYDWNDAISSLQGEQAAKIAELEAKLAEVEKDAERYRAIKQNVEEIRVSPRSSSAVEFGIDDIRMKWQIKAHMSSYTCVGEVVSFDEASDMLVTAIQESKKGGACE